MTDLWNNEPGFPLRALNQITIPGTHDAGCYIDRGWYGNFQSRTQTETVAQQLAGGIRYFDLRPRATNGQFWTYHSPVNFITVYYGDRLDGPAGILNQVAAFMNNLLPGDRELVILNISHFGGFNNVQHGGMIGAITAALGNHLVQDTQANLDLFNATYTALLTDPITGNVASRVAILYDGALDTDRELYIQNALAGLGGIPALPAGFFVLSPKYVPPANPIFLFDQYAGTGNLTTMRANQFAKLTNRVAYPYSTRAWALGAGNWPANAAGGVAGTLHLYSWTLTPQPLSDPLTAAQDTSNPALLDALSGRNPGCAWAGPIYDPAADPKINVLYVDDYSSEIHDTPGSAWDQLALPVAIAARLNMGPLTTW
ncbi:hypothetical protein ACNOYE_30860 [Nannocystaceae bacterium ST9]